MNDTEYEILLKKHDCRYLPENIVAAMIQDRKVRTEIAKGDFALFFHFYLAHYVKYATAPFQHELLRLAGEDSSNLYVVAFRGSGKSTILTTAYPIWAILGKQEKKFVLILCQTRSQAKQHMMNLKRELESNKLLRDDLGPFEEESDEWGSASLVFSKLDARITAASTEQSIRGLRHNEHRPDLIICDDVEDLASVKTREGRQKTHQWLTGEVIPSGDRGTRIVVVGNLLHEDSLLMRLRQDVEESRIDGTFKSYPLLDEAGESIWPGKYPFPASIETERRMAGNDIAWQREYLLRIISDAGRVVHPEWLQYYDPETDLPRNGHHLVDCLGVDLAISEKSSADCTAMVMLKIYERDGRKIAYVMPHPFNRRVTFPEQVAEIMRYGKTMSEHGIPKIFVEKVGYQAALAQELQSRGIRAEGVTPHGDKRERIALTTAAIKEGLILFPKKGAEELILQLIGFGTEKHDDLADAFSLVANKFIEYLNEPQAGVIFLNTSIPRHRESVWDDDDDDDDFVIDYSGRRWA